MENVSCKYKITVWTINSVPRFLTHVVINILKCQSVMWLISPIKKEMSPLFHLSCSILGTYQICHFKSTRVDPLAPIVLFSTLFVAFKNNFKVTVTPTPCLTLLGKIFC